MDVTKRVGVELTAKSMPEAGAAFKQIEDRARGLQENMKRTTERVDKLGHGVVLLNRGFAGLVTHGQAAAYAIGGVTGGTKELAETTNKFLGAVTLIEASVITFKGLSFVIQAGASWMAAYAASAGAATVANAALAKSHTVAAGAATAHARAEASVALAMYLQQGGAWGYGGPNMGGMGQPRLPAGGGMLMLTGPGGSAGGGGGFGWGSVGRGAVRSLVGAGIGQVVGEIAGSDSPWRDRAIGAGAMLAAPMIGKGIAAGASYMGVTGAGIGAVAAPVGLAAAAAALLAGAGFIQIDTLTSAVSGKETALKAFWDEFFGEGKRRGERLDQELEMINKRRALAAEQRTRFTEDYAITSAGAVRYGEIQRSIRGLQSEAEMERGLPGRASANTTRILAHNAGLLLPFLGSHQLFRDAAGREHLYQFGQQFGEFSKERGLAEARAESKKRMAGETLAASIKDESEARTILSVFGQMNEQYKVVHAAEGEHLGKELEATSQRRLDAERQYIEAVREENRERIETIRGTKQLAEAEESRARSIRLAEQDRQKDLRRQYVLMDPGQRRMTEKTVDRINAELAGGSKVPLPLLRDAFNNPFLQERAREAIDRRAEAMGMEFGRLGDKAAIFEKGRQAAALEERFKDIRIQNENRITVEVKRDAEDTAKAIVDKLIPILVEIQQQAIAKVVADLTRRDQVRRIGMKVAAPQ